MDSLEKLNINSRIFRSYDIRGVYPGEVNEKTFFELGKALSQLLKGTVVVGHDTRLSSPMLYQAIVRGLTLYGGKRIEVLPVGLLTTPMIGFLVNELKAGGGIIVTASHNPKEDNGLKAVGKKGVPVPVSEMKEWIAQHASDFSMSKLPAKVLEARPAIYYRDLYANFLKKNLALTKPLKVVADCSNGTAGLVLEVLKSLAPQFLDLVIINGNPDGNFPAHGPNPMLAGAFDDLKKAVVQEKADVGILFDADGDRILFMDDRGRVVPPDPVLLLLAGTYKGKVVIEPRAGFLTREEFAKHQRPIVESRVGHYFLKLAMKKTGAPFAGELSGHYYFKDFFGLDSGLFALVKFINTMNSFDAPLSEWLDQHPKYPSSGEINFHLKKPQQKEAILQKLEATYGTKAKAVSKLDGVRMEFENYWVLARPSGNEDIMRLLIEARDEATLKSAVKEFSVFIQKEAK